MWILLGVTFEETAENEAVTYFIGVFDKLQGVNDAMKEMREKESTIVRRCEKNLFFSKEVDTNMIYDFSFTNSVD
jgi:hypothetical protein